MWQLAKGVVTGDGEAWSSIAVAVAVSKRAVARFRVRGEGKLGLGGAGQVSLGDRETKKGLYNG